MTAVSDSGGGFVADFGERLKRATLWGGLPFLVVGLVAALEVMARRAVLAVSPREAFLTRRSGS
jgi:hypothetical protein